MNIKQQRQVKTFLNEEFGQEKGNQMFIKQENTLNELIENIKDKSKNQAKTLVQTILPRIALYKTLSADDLSEKAIYNYMHKYMVEKVAAKKHSFTAKLEAIPGFYALYSNVFLKIMRITDLHESTQNHGKDYFDVNIKKCLWYTACVENGCEELCRLFCDVDNVTYGGLKKMGFSRTKTLGYGGDCCDFHFYKK